MIINTLRNNLLAALTMLTFSANAQNDSSNIATDIEIEIQTTDFGNSRKKINDFLVANNVTIQSQFESKSLLTLKFNADENLYHAYDSLLNTLGFISLKRIKSENNADKIAQINHEIAYLKQKKDSYLERLKKTDEKIEAYSSLWNETKQIEEKIFFKESELLGMGNQDHIFSVKVDINDEVTSPENTRISFVNMPGFEYSYLNIESPKPGISAASYNGYFLKYLFTKGKSYATFGAYTNRNIKDEDSSTISEMFLIGFGQDFYSRHLGRGSRKFFNLYSGYTIGGAMTSSKSTNSSTVYLTPIVGIELFKNKFLLIDNNVKYFIPFGEIKNLRGVSYNVSINFVF